MRRLFLPLYGCFVMMRLSPHVIYIYLRTFSVCLKNFTNNNLREVNIYACVKSLITLSSNIHSPQLINKLGQISLNEYLLSGLSVLTCKSHIPTRSYSIANSLFQVSTISSSAPSSFNIKTNL